MTERHLTEYRSVYPTPLDTLRERGTARRCVHWRRVGCWWAILGPALLSGLAFVASGEARHWYGRYEQWRVNEERGRRQAASDAWVRERPNGPRIQLGFTDQGPFLEADFDKGMPSEGLRDLATHPEAAALHQLFLQPFADLNDGDLATISAFSGLRQLWLPEKTKFGAGSWSALAALPELRYLNIPDAIDDEALIALGRSASLERLSLSDAFNVGDAGLAGLGCATALTELDIQVGPGVTAAGFAALVAAPALTKLRVVWRRGATVDDDTLFALAKSNSLTDLYLDAMRPACTDKGFTALAMLPKLARLRFGGGRGHITDAGLAWIARSRSLYGLAISNLPGVTDQGMGVLARSRTLRHLRLNNLSGVTDEGLSALASMPGLENLTLIALRNITDDGFATLARAPALSKLCLAEIPALTDRGLVAWRDAPALKRIELRGGLDGITDAGLSALGENPRLLEAHTDTYRAAYSAETAATLQRRLWRERTERLRRSGLTTWPYHLVGDDW